MISLSPPQTEESILQKWCGIIHDRTTKSHLYLGKATPCLLDDVDGPVHGIEFGIKPHAGTVLQSNIN